VARVAQCAVVVEVSLAAALADRHDVVGLPPGAYTRPLIGSTRAVPDTKYTLSTPQDPEHLLNTPEATPKCNPYPTESAYVKPKSGRV